MTNEQLAGKILCHMKNKLEQRTGFAYCIRKSDVEAVTAILDSRPVPESAEELRQALTQIVNHITTFIENRESKPTIMDVCSKPEKYENFLSDLIDIANQALAGKDGES